MPDKGLAYSPPIDDAKTSKISNIGPKLTAEKKSSNIDLVKAVNQVQKSNTVSNTQKSVSTLQQDSKIVASNVKSDPKQSQRPKMELPSKMCEQKLQLQGLKGPPPNGLNKEILNQKVLTPNSNGFIKQNTQENNYTGNQNVSPNLEKRLGTNNCGLSTESQIQSSEIHDEDSDKQYYSQNYNKKSSSPLSETKNECSENSKSMSPVSNNLTNGSQTPNSVNYNCGQSDNNSCQNKIKSELHVSQQSQVSDSPVNNLGQNLGNSTQNLAPGSSIPKPTALVKGTSKPPKDNCNIGNPNPAKYKPDSLHRKLDPNTVAMISPMPSISDLMSESSHSNSNSTGQSNSSDSSVIYRPSSESGSDIKTIPNRKIDTTFEQMEKVSWYY